MHSTTITLCGLTEWRGGLRLLGGGVGERLEELEQNNINKTRTRQQNINKSNKTTTRQQDINKSNNKDKTTLCLLRVVYG